MAPLLNVRHKGIRMGLVLSLMMIVLGTLLGGSEGLKCYDTDLGAGEGQGPKECDIGENSCYHTFTNTTGVKGCFANMDRPCVEQAFGNETCIDSSLQTELDKLDECEIENGKGRRNSKKGRQTEPIPGSKLCYCWTDLCNNGSLPVRNPAGHSTPNKQVIFGILVVVTPALVRIWD